MFQVDDLERDALEILHLVQSLKNRLAPVNRIPPEVLTLIPDFWDLRSCDRDVIALSHVCRAWREIFISRSSLWSNFDCEDADKTRVYLERSGTSPITLNLCRDHCLSSLDPFVQIIPQVIGRLKSLSVEARPRNLQAITAHLSHSAPLLQRLYITGGCYLGSQHNHVLPSTMFNGDLSSLRALHLEYVRAELPWRNMVNLTSFTLRYAPAGDSGQLLDFFESAPRLRKIDLLATAISGGENGRLVSLDHLKRMDIIDCGPTSTFLNHLVIPVGAKLTTQPDSQAFTIEEHIPRSLDNLKNVSNLIRIDLDLDEFLSLFVRLSGPDGQLCMRAMERATGIDTSLALESLARFDTSKTERLKIDSIHAPFRDSAYRALLEMKNLRTLVLSRCSGLLCTFMDALNPNTRPSKEVVCPLLEELAFVLRVRRDFEEDDREEFDMGAVIEMAAARASRGARLRIVKDQAKLDLVDVVELRKHVLQVECGPEVDVYDDGGDYNDKEE